MSSTSPPPIVSSRPDSRSTYRSPGSSGSVVARNRPHRARRARSERLAAEHAHPHRQLARPDVGDVRAPARHVVVETGEHVERGVEPIGRTPAVRCDHGVAAADLVVADAVEVERDPVAGADLVDGRPERLDRTDAGRVTTGLDRHGVVVTRACPPVSVPVTTVPLPLAANTRSIHSRGRPRSALGGVSATSASSAASRARRGRRR